MDYQQIQPLLIGQWEEILTNYGIEIPKWQGKNTINHPCPLCGGDDRAHWRDTDGRLSLYCRNCANETMKSAENVIMEAHNLRFPDLVKELADFVNHIPQENHYQAKQKVNAKPKRNMPVGHKQDHDKSKEILSKSDKTNNNKILLSIGAQYPCDLPHSNGFPLFDIVNEQCALVNLATLTGNYETRFAAGGLSYGAWHKIPACDVRSTGKVSYAVDIVEAIQHWYRTGNEVRCVFDVYNLAWMMKVGLVIDDSVLVLTPEQRDLL